MSWNEYRCYAGHRTWHAQYEGIFVTCPMCLRRAQFFGTVAKRGEDPSNQPTTPPPPKGMNGEH